LLGSGQTIPQIRQHIRQKPLVLANAPNHLFGRVPVTTVQAVVVSAKGMDQAFLQLPGGHSRCIHGSLLSVLAERSISPGLGLGKVGSVLRIREPRTTFMDKVKAFQVLDVAARDGKAVEVEVQVIALGDEVAWVSLPGEIFVELGLVIEKNSPFLCTMIAELANGSIGYIPDKPAYA